MEHGLNATDADKKHTVLTMLTEYRDKFMVSPYKFDTKRFAKCCNVTERTVNTHTKEFRDELLARRNEDIKALIEKGLSDGQIGKELGFSHSVAKGVRAEMEDTNQAKPEQTVTLEDLKKDLHVEANTLRAFQKQHGKEAATQLLVEYLRANPEELEIVKKRIQQLSRIDAQIKAMQLKEDMEKLGLTSSDLGL